MWRLRTFGLPFHVKAPLRFAKRATSWLPSTRRPLDWRKTFTLTGLLPARAKLNCTRRFLTFAPADLKPLVAAAHAAAAAFSSPGLAPGPPNSALFEIRAAETSWYGSRT